MPMFTTRRRTNIRRTTSWSRKKTRRSPKAITIAMVAVGGLVGAEILLRIIAPLTGLDRQLNADSTSAMVQAYQMRFLSPEGQPYKTLPGAGQLMATRNPLLGYQLKPSQQTPFWIINEQGFRDPDPVSPQKPEGEVRIFVLGGSAAFGQLSPNDQTLVSYHLEQLLNTRVASQRSNANRYQPEILPYTADEVNKVMNRPARIPDRQYRVINAAVPGYTSGNELALLMQEISTYSPDIIISLGGYSDLLLPSSQSAADIPGLDNILEGKGESWTSQASRGFNNWLGRFYLIKGIQRLTGQSSATLAETGALNMASNDKSSAQRLATTSAELDQRIARYQNHLLQLVRWSSASKKRVIIGLQPEVTAYSKAKPSAAEAEMLKQLGQPYADQIQAGYTKLAAAANRAAQSSANAKVLNLYEQIGQQDKSGLFVSPEGLSDAGSKMVADRFYGAIATQLALKPKPFGSP